MAMPEGRQPTEENMAKHPTTKALRAAAPKTPTTRAVVQRVQRSTASNGNGQQAPWVSALQRTADKAAAGAPTSQGPARKSGDQPRPAPTPDHAKDNRANQRNPNNVEYYKSRGLPGRPADQSTHSSRRVRSATC